MSTSLGHVQIYGPFIFLHLIFAEFWTFQPRFRNWIQKNSDTYSWIFQQNSEKFWNLKHLLESWILCSHTQTGYSETSIQYSERFRQKFRKIQTYCSDTILKDLFFDFKPPFDHYIRHARLGIGIKKPIKMGRWTFKAALHVL